ncbi:hypothetical protein FQZ97_277390 [compost metagenome]
MLGQSLQRYAVQPAGVLIEVADAVEGALGALQQFDEDIQVFAEDGMARGLGNQPGTLEPLRSPAVQGTNIDRRCGQALTEELGEQGMQLVPRMTILIPGGQHEQVLRLERRDQLLCVGCVRHMTRDGHVDAAENRNLLQEVDQRLRQWGEDFLGKIVGKSRLVLRRGAQRLFAGAAFQRVRHQLQADRPPGGHVVNRMGNIQLQVVAQAGFEESLRLAEAETQFGTVDLAHFPPCRGACPAGGQA